MSTKLSLAALAAIAGLCGWFLLDRTTPLAQPLPVPPAFEELHAENAQPTTEVPAPTRVAAASTPGRSTVAPGPGEPEAVTDPRAGWWLVGRLLDWDGDTRDAAELDINRSGRASMKAAALLDGSFEIDISQLFESSLNALYIPSKPAGGAEPEIEIWVRHADYMPTRELIPSEAITSSRAPGERIELRRDIRMRHAASVSGRVRVENAADARGVELELMPSEGQGLGGFGVILASYECEADGLYRLRAAGSGEYLVLAKLAGWRSTAVRVLLAERATLELPDIVLEAGEAQISGRVELPPGVSENQSAGRIPIWPSFHRQEIQVHSHPSNRQPMPATALGASGSVVISEQNKSSFTELRGGWPHKSQVASVQADGAFRLGGLDAGEWELQIHGIRSSALLAMKRPTIVHAPAHDIVIGSHLCRLSALVTAGGRGVKDADIVWSATLEDGSQQASTTRTDEEGRVVVIGDVSMDYVATVARAGQQEARVEIPAAGRPKDQLIPIALAEGAPVARLVLRVPEGTRPFERIHVRLSPAPLVDSAPGPRPQLIDQDCELREGAYTIEEIRPGRYTLEVAPSQARGPVAFFGSYLMDERMELEFAPGAQEERVLAMRSGGRLRIEAEGFTDGSHLVLFELVDAQGAVVAGPTVVAVEGDGRGTFSGSEGRLSLKYPNAFQPCLEPGVYEVRVKGEEYAVDAVRVEVRATETATAKLKARRR